MFFGAIPAIGAALAVNWQTSMRVRALLGAGLVLYLTCGAVTAAGNVPLNNDLARYALADASAARAAFEADWNRLNLIRTLAVVASFASMAAALVSLRRPDRGHRGPHPC